MAKPIKSLLHVVLGAAAMALGIYYPDSWPAAGGLASGILIAVGAVMVGSVLGEIVKSALNRGPVKFP